MCPQRNKEEIAILRKVAHVHLLPENEPAANMDVIAAAIIDQYFSQDAAGWTALEDSNEAAAA